MTSHHDGSKTGLEPIARRVPIRSKIDLRFHNFEGLVTGVSANLSTSGMFIQTDSPKAVGSEFSFQIRIEDWSPIQGSAEVIWTRATAEGPERPAGMGVRFVDLDPQSRRMIRWLVDKHLEDGGKPFDPTLVPPGASSVSRRPAAAQAGGGRAGSGQGSRVAGRSGLGTRKGLQATIAVLLLAGLAVAIYVLWRDRQVGRGQLGGPAPAQADAEVAILDDGGEGREEPATALDDVEVRISAEGVTTFVESWEAAWESRDPERVIALYSDSFQATAYGGRESWMEDLTRKMSQADYIRVAVSALEIEFPAADNARATFYRSLRSNVSDETRRMVLDLEPVDSGWRIRSERLLD